MAIKKYYISIDSYWVNGPDWFVGPFDSADAAAAEVERALSAPGSKVQLHNRTAVDVRDGIRVWDVMSRGEAKREGLRESGWGKINLIGKNIPLTLTQLKAVVEELDRLE